MGEGHQQHQFLLRHHHAAAPNQTARGSSRLGGLKGGEIVEVQGGHIVRATGRKDRHSKVCTAKGPRDRRVRLSAHTAIQFYDVQDRLGYDRPSKAVDWLIKNAKAAIDELAELPPWRPTATPTADASDPENEEGQELGGGDSSGKKPLGVDDPSVAAPTSGCSAYGFSNSSFLPPSMDSDSIADTIKSFFPMTASSSPSVGFHSYSTEAANQAQDLRLSLQSFHDQQILHNHHHHQGNSTPPSEQTFFSSGPLVYDSTSVNWSEQQPRLVPWTSSADTAASGGGGYVFNLPLPQQHGVPLFGQSPFLSQRGPLQSSNNSPSILAWMEPVGVAAAAAEHQEATAHAAFTSSGVFSGFHIPARIQGEEEEHDKLSSAPRR